MSQDARYIGQSTTGTTGPRTISCTGGETDVVVILAIYFDTVYDNHPRAGGAPSIVGLGDMSQIGETLDGTYYGLELWQYRSPPVDGSYTISIPNTNTSNVYGVAAAITGDYEDVDQSTIDTGNDLAPSTTVGCTGSAETIIALVVSFSGPGSATSPCVMLHSESDMSGNPVRDLIKRTNCGPGDVSIGTTYTVPGVYAIAAVSFSVISNDVYATLAITTDDAVCESESTVVELMQISFDSSISLTTSFTSVVQVS